MTTTAPKRSIFRNQALQKYRQNQEKSVLPRVVAPPVFLLFWILLITLTSAGFVAWLGQVPLYVTGSGVVLDQDTASNQNDDEATAIIILPASQVARVHPGLHTQIQIGSTGPMLTRVVNAVSPGVLSPSEIHQRYGVQMADPSQVISVRLGHAVSRRAYAGSPVRAQIEIGSRRLLSLFPFFSSLWKDA